MSHVMLSVLVTYILSSKRRETYEKDQTSNTDHQGCLEDTMHRIAFQRYETLNNMEVCHDYILLHSQMIILSMLLFQ